MYSFPSAGVLMGDIAIAGLTKGHDGTSSPTFSTASVSPTGSVPVYVFVWSYAGGPSPNQPSAAGFGVTWDVVLSVLGDDNSGNDLRFTWFRGLMPATPGSDTIDFDFSSQNQAGVYWVVVEGNSEIDVGDGGADAIVQVSGRWCGIGGGGATASLASALSAFGDAANNALLVFGMVGGDTTSTAGEAGLTEVYDGAGDFAPCYYRVGQDTTPTFTRTPSGSWACAAAEIKKAAAGGASQAPRSMHQYRTRRAA